MIIAAAAVATQQVAYLRVRASRLLAEQPDLPSLAEELDRVGTLSDGEWMQFSQMNLDEGGPVWLECRSYYLDTDRSDPVLRD